MEKNNAVDNTRAEHWCTLENHFAIGGVNHKMRSPSVVRETRGTKHARTSAVNGLQKFAGGKQNCRSTIFDATPHADYFSVQPVLRVCATDKRKQKRGKAHSNVGRHWFTLVKHESCTL